MSTVYIGRLETSSVSSIKNQTLKSVRWAADLRALAVVLGALRNRPLLQASRRHPPATPGTAARATTTGCDARPRHRLRGPLRGSQGITARSCEADGGRAASPGRDRARAGRHAVPGPAPSAGAAAPEPPRRRERGEGGRGRGWRFKLTMAAPGSGEGTWEKETRTRNSNRRRNRNCSHSDREGMGCNNRPSNKNRTRDGNRAKDRNGMRARISQHSQTDAATIRDCIWTGFDRVRGLVKELVALLPKGQVLQER